MGTTLVIETSTSPAKKTSNMQLKFLLLSASCLLSLSLALPRPKAKAEARAYTGGLISLDSPYILPLLLAGAAFAKGYLFGNLKRSSSLNSVGYGYERSFGYPYGFNGYYGRRIGSENYYGTSFQPSEESTAPAGNQGSTYQYEYSY